MLTHIHIKNFIIVQSLSLDFHEGLHVLTGETGAGKSIWIDAIEIGLGGRADANMIFPGEKTCDITLCFDLRQLPHAKAWLQSQELPIDEECIIRRTIDREKPSRTTINGMPVPQQSVRTLSEFILSIHGQHQHQRLLKIEAQRDCIDRYAGNETLLLTIKTHYNAWHQLHQQHEKLRAQSHNKSSDLTLWQYQLTELNVLQLQENEYESLFSEYQQHHRRKQLATQLQTALSLIDGEELSPITSLQRAQQQLHIIHSDDENIRNIQQLLQTAVIHCEEARDALHDYCNKTEFSEEKLFIIEKRLTQLQDIARKHRVEPTELFQVITTLSNKIMQLETIDEHLTALEKEQQKIITDYQKNAEKLSDSRKKAVKKLSDFITEQLQTLGMKGSVFEAHCQPINTLINPHGQENIQFLIATNVGQTPHALSQIISGGELSRLSLVIQVLTAHKNNTPTLIFDEIDVGIGGKTADLVGKLLRELGKQAQVLCVTHLPQVAAYGHHHYQAEKNNSHQSTFTTMKLLDSKERSQELARMLSGAEITEKSISHANELLAMHNT
ncbi:MAG: DNA repair protein RecN [Coxiellaceae bacterium]|nr:DNA repair protein RecN [Coxiellaceae bacterium]